VFVDLCVAVIAITELIFSNGADEEKSVVVTGRLSIYVLQLSRSLNSLLTRLLNSHGNLFEITTIMMAMTLFDERFVTRCYQSNCHAIN
jgi:hypothetical protein